MRTKTLLLSAAAIAAGLVSSQAQPASNVYSANIVGYVTAVFQPTGKYTLSANPLDNGSNNVVGLLDAALPNKSQVLVWFPSIPGYITATKGGGTWDTNIAIPPGAGFFVKTPNGQVAPITNTYVGNIIVNPNGGTNRVALPAAYVLNGTPIPFNGALNDAGGTNTVNLGASLPNKSQILAWDSVGQGFITATKGGGTWDTNLAIIPGGGYFINSKTPTNWDQQLQAQ
jgi:hypothetical protein